MATPSDDPIHVSLRVAESVVALARAEFRLALAGSRALGQRFGVALAISALALLLVQVAVFLLAISPVLWTFRQGPTMAAVALSLGAAASVSLLALRRWVSFGEGAPRPESPPHAAATELESSGPPEGRPSQTIRI